MADIFLKLLNLSISASWLVLVVLVLRFAFKRVPKWVNVLLWGIVALRLMLPFSIESALSLVPSAETISPTEVHYDLAPTITSGVEIIDGTINPVIQENLATVSAANGSSLIAWTEIASAVWLIGLAAMFLYALVSYLRLRQRVRVSLWLRENVYLCDAISSPFILGVIKPRIYLPSELNEVQQKNVLAHECSHLARRDHRWKPLGFALLSVYWFNPVLWLAYVLLCRDIELACDERVIRNMDESAVQTYSTVLLACSVPRKMVVACPLAFGEIGVKERVRNALHYKKPAFWIVAASVIVCIVVAVCFLTNPPTDTDAAGLVGFHREQVAYVDVTDENSVQTSNVQLNEEETDTVYALLDALQYKRLGTASGMRDCYARLYFVSAAGERCEIMLSQREMLVNPITGGKKARLYELRSGSTELRDYLLEFISQSGTLKEAYHRERSEYLFRSFGMNPSDYQYAQDYYALNYLDTDAYTSMRKVYFKSGITLPSFFITEDAEAVYVVFQDENALNYMYKFTRAVDGSTYTSECFTMQEDARYQDAVLSYSEYERMHTTKTSYIWCQASFPNSDKEKTEHNKAIFEIVPFDVEFELPEGWSIGNYDPRSVSYLYSGAWSRVGLYDADGNCVGAVGYNIYDVNEVVADEPMSIYSQVALGNDYQFDVRETYTVIKENDWYQTAQADVYYAPNLMAGGGETGTTNYGILSRALKQAVYVAFEFNRGALTDEQVKEIACSVAFLMDGASGEERSYPIAEAADGEKPVAYDASDDPAARWAGGKNFDTGLLQIASVSEVAEDGTETDITSSVDLDIAASAMRAMRCTTVPVQANRQADDIRYHVSAVYDGVEMDVLLGGTNLLCERGNERRVWSIVNGELVLGIVAVNANNKRPLNPWSEGDGAERTYYTSVTNDICQATLAVDYRLTPRGDGTWRIAEITGARTLTGYQWRNGWTYVPEGPVSVSDVSLRGDGTIAEFAVSYSASLGSGTQTYDGRVQIQIPYDTVIASSIDVTNTVAPVS